MKTRLVLAACVLVLAAKPSSATTYDVTTIAGDPSSAGSLGAALTGTAGDPTSTDDISFDPSLFATPQSISLNSGSYTSVVKNPGVSLSLDAPPSSLTINDGGFTVLNLSGGGTFNIGAGITITGTSATGITVGNSTVLDLNGGQGTGFTLSGATVTALSSLTNTGNVALAAGVTLGAVSGSTMSFTGAVSGTGGLVVAGPGSVDFTGTSGNSFTGGVTINGAGTLNVSADTQLGDPGNALTLNGGTLNTVTGITSSRAITIAGSGGTLEVGTGQTTLLTGTIAGTGGLSVTGGGVLDLTGLAGATFTGGMSVIGSTLNVSADTQLGDPANGLTLNGGILNTTAGITSARTITLAGSGGTLNVATGLTTALTGTIAGTGGLSLTGGGILDLTGLAAATYTGGMSVIGSTLNVTADSQLGDASNGLTLNGGILNTVAGINSARTITLAGNGGTFNVGTGSTTALTGTIAGTGTLSLTGGGVLDLTGLAGATYTGGMSVIGSTLNVSADSQLGNSANGLTLNGGLLNATANITSARAITLAGAGGTINVASGQATTLTGSIAGTGGLSLTGGGILDVTGTSGSSFFGGMTVVGSTLNVSADSQLGDVSNGLTLNGATLHTIEGITSARAITLTGTGGTFNIAGSATTLLTGTVAGTGALNVIGGGILDFTGLAGDTFTGNVNVVGATLNVSADSQLGNAANGLTLSSATLNTTIGLASARNITLAGGGGTFNIDAATTTSLTGSIAGTGGLNVTGGGTLDLTGLAGATFTGGVAVTGSTLNVTSDSQLGALANGLTLSGGTLDTLAAANSARAITLAGSGGTFNVAAATTTLTGSISGSGGLNVAGGGTLDLTGLSSATYTGGVAVSSASTLNISADSQLGAAANGLTLSSGTLNTAIGLASARSIALAGDGGTFIVGAGTATTLSGAIGGAGALAFIGGGTLTLSGANSYSGGTSVLNSTLIVGSASGLGTGSLSLDGSTFRATTAITTAGGLSLSGASGAAVDTDGNALTFTGGLTGSNALTKIGLGALSFSGPIAFTGDMTIDAGTVSLGAANASTGGNLTVGSGAAFAMNGFAQTQQAVVNNGTLTTGAATLNAASYSGSGTLSVTLTPGTTSLIVAGTAALGGGKLVVARPTKAGVYNIVQAGSVGSQFSSITVAPDTTLLGTQYTATGLTLDLLNGYRFTAAASPNLNRSSVVQTLDAISVSAAPSAAMIASLVQLNNLTPAQLQQTFDQLAPTAFHAAAMGMSTAGSTAQTGAVGQRLAGLRNGTSDGSSVAAFKATGDVLYPGVLLADAPGDVQSPLLPAPQEEKCGYYAAGVGTFGRLDGAATSAGSSPGFDFSSAGAALGTDCRVDENFVAGVALGYTEGSASYDSGLGSVSNELFHYGAYGAVQDDASYGSLYLGGTNDTAQAARNITDLGLTAKSNPAGNEFNADAAAGFNMRTRRYVFSPFGDLAYDRVMTGGYSESGAGGLDENVSPQTANSLRSTVGLKVSRKFDVARKEVTPYLSGAWRHEYDDQSQAVDAEFASAGAPNVFTTRTADIARDGAAVGAGVVANLGNGVSSKLAYSGDMRPGFHEHSFVGEFRVQF